MKKKPLPKPRWPILTIAQILGWADEHHYRAGKWPTHKSGVIPKSLGEKWFNVDAVLRRGGRGLNPDSSIARLLAKYRGHRNSKSLPALQEEKILRWVDAHHRRAGRWPKCRDGRIPDAPGETWMAVERALTDGNRGLPGGTSLAGFLKKHRGVRNILDQSPWTVKQILAWADSHHRRTGKWPNINSGCIPGSLVDKWSNIDGGLRVGLRGLPPGSSLARLLAKHRSFRNPRALPNLTINKILKWSDAHHRRTGRWPNKAAGSIPDALGETWNAVAVALYKGLRGLPGGASLPGILHTHRGVRNTGDLPPLTEKMIITWADDHYRRTGKWPTPSSGWIPNTPGEKWINVNLSLRQRGRGLPNFSSLAILLSKHARSRNSKREGRKIEV